jgi:DNA-binding protein H-NS
VFQSFISINKWEPNMVDLESLSLPELRNLEVQIKAEIRRRGSHTQRAIKQVQKIAEKSGLTVSELLAALNGGAAIPELSSGFSRSGGVIKYRNPTNPSQGWTGHGRKPGWVVTYLDNGGSLEQLAAV